MPTIFTVTNGNDSGAGSLRQAVLDANGNAVNDDLILFSGVSTIILTSGPLTITSDLFIEGDRTGDGVADVTIGGGGAAGLFEVQDGTTRLDSLTLTDAGDGALVIQTLGSAEIRDSTFVNNISGSSGGAIRSDGVLDVANTLFNGNGAPQGGAVDLRSGSESRLVNATFVYNAATEPGLGQGGAIRAYDAHVELDHVTISGNSASRSIGGVYAYGADMTGAITGSIISGNMAPSRADLDAALLAVTDSVLGPAPTITVGPGSSGNATEDVGVTGTLAALADNGGAVQTRLLLPGAQALELVSPGQLPADILDIDADSVIAEALPLDGRGGPRVVGAPDAGAVESTDQVIVDSLADEADGDYSTGDLSLREALEIVSDGGTIRFAEGIDGGMILLDDTLGVLTLGAAGTVTIEGDSDSDGDRITIDGNFNTRLLDVTAGQALMLEALTLRNGYAGYDPGVAAGITNAGDLTLRDVTLGGNYGYGGYARPDLATGALHNSGSVVLDNVLFSGNAARGGDGYYGNPGLSGYYTGPVGGNPAFTGDGTPGEAGDDAGDAVSDIFNIAGGTITLAAGGITIIGSNATGGDGGKGSDGGDSAGVAGLPSSAGDGGDGGDGGSAFAIRNDGVIGVSGGGRVLFSPGDIVAGTGGAAGDPGAALASGDTPGTPGEAGADGTAYVTISGSGTTGAGIDFLVTQATGSGEGSLAAAVAAAAELAGTDRITFAEGLGTIRLDGPLVIAAGNDLVIDGDLDDDGTADIVLSGDSDGDGTGDAGHFHNQANLVLDHLILDKGVGGAGLSHDGTGPVNLQAG